jgi:hypothetical protein
MLMPGVALPELSTTLTLASARQSVKPNRLEQGLDPKGIGPLGCWFTVHPWSCHSNVVSSLKTPIVWPKYLGQSSGLSTIQRFNNSFLVTQYSDVKPFKSNFARMGMFLTAKGRYELYKTISKHQDKIIYAHTDGFISTKRLKIKQGQNMGELRFEGKYENLEIKNKNYKSFSSFK